MASSRTAIEFLRDPRVRDAPEAERLAFLERRAGLTRGEALEALRLADAAEPRQEHSLSSTLWWGALAAAGAALGGGAALLSRDPSRMESWLSAPLSWLALPEAAQVGADSPGAGSGDRSPPAADALDAVRALLAEHAARHERSLQQLRELMDALASGQRATTAALERLSARLDAAAAGVPSEPLAAPGESAPPAHSNGAMSDGTPASQPRGAAAALRGAHAELFGAPEHGRGSAAPLTPGEQPRPSSSELGSPAEPPSPAVGAPPYTPASTVLPSTPRLSYAELAAHVQQGRPVPGYVQVDDSPIRNGGASPATSEPVRHARPKPWERAGVLGASGSRLDSASRVTELPDSPGGPAAAERLSDDRADSVHSPYVPYRHLRPLDVLSGSGAGGSVDWSEQHLGSGTPATPVGSISATDRALLRRGADSSEYDSGTRIEDVTGL